MVAIHWGDDVIGLVPCFTEGKAESGFEFSPRLLDKSRYIDKHKVAMNASLSMLTYLAGHAGPLGGRRP